MRYRHCAILLRDIGPRVGARTLWGVRDVGLPQNGSDVRLRSKQRWRLRGFWFGHIQNRNLTFRSEDEARLGASAPHLEGRNEVKNRNGACVMEVAAMGCRAKM
jgi:hypothetical protein